MPHDVCVIGAGWSGLSAATALRAAGLDVVVVEKSRGPGGRCATRRQDGFAFDHGGQYFTARSAEFVAAVNSWKRQRLVAPWEPHIRVFGPRPAVGKPSPAERLVGVPGMNAVLKHLAGSVNCLFGWRAERLAREGAGWIIHGAEASGRIQAGHLLITAPPRQTAELLDGHSSLAGRLAKVPMSPCWALMLGFSARLDAGFEAAFDNEGPLSWLARNSSKPDRGTEAWVAHASARWSESRLEESNENVASALLEAFRERVPSAAGISPQLISVHRWRYALAPEPLNEACLHDETCALVVAGDWCAGNRIEGAWLSGQAAAQTLLGRF